MPASEARPVETVEWTREGALYLEPRLKALGVPHGLTTRGMGPMAAPERRCAAAREAGITDDAPLTLKQVHSAEVHPAALDRAGSEGDGWIAGPGFLVGVFVADCLPLIVFDEPVTRVAVVHAGWRGIAAGIGEAAVAAFGGAPERLSAAIGPHIGACCYEVGPELRGDFAAPFFDGNRLDLGAALRSRLEDAGLRPERIGVSALCTRCREDDFFSFRRDGTKRNMMAFAGVPR